MDAAAEIWAALPWGGSSYHYEGKDTEVLPVPAWQLSGSGRAIRHAHKQEYLAASAKRKWDQKGIIQKGLHFADRALDIYSLATDVKAAYSMAKTALNLAQSVSRTGRKLKRHTTHVGQLNNAYRTAGWPDREPLNLYNAVKTAWTRDGWRKPLRFRKHAFAALRLRRRYRTNKYRRRRY